MKRLLLMLSAGLLLAGCSSEDEVPEPIRPVLSVKVEPQVQSQLGRVATGGGRAGGGGVVAAAAPAAGAGPAAVTAR